MNDTLWVSVSAVAGAIGAVGIIFTFVWRHVRPITKGSRQVWEHVIGVPANPITGQQAIPGLFPRLASIEETLNEIKHETRPNSGESLRDAADKAVEMSAKALDAATKALAAVERIEARLKGGEDEPERN